MLVFSDASGIETSQFFFDKDPDGGARTVLIATQEFEDFTGIVPDFIIPANIRMVPIFKSDDIVMPTTNGINKPKSPRDPENSIHVKRCGVNFTYFKIPQIY